MTDKKKPEPHEQAKKPTENVFSLSKKVDALQTEIEMLKRCLAKMAHYTGQQMVLDEFKISRWKLDPASMKKYRG